ncbi:MAG: adenylate/guanylate cyclase domain-containing protein [Thermodesulfobacteriota bacterium]|nr:adenylate/guanylate cyclase domain-containing protein [Thermodesulfobacteriota bacterium]
MLRLSSEIDPSTVYEMSRGKDSFSIGRDKKSNIIIDNDSNVSRQHGQIFFKDGKYYYKDLGSTNGTIIIRKRNKIFLDGEQFCQLGLKDSDRLICGDTVFLIEIDVIEKEAIESYDEANGTKTIIFSQNLQDIDKIKSSVEFEGKTLETLYEMCTYLQSTLDINTVLDNIGNSILKVIEKCENVVVILGEVGATDILPMFYKSRNNAYKNENIPLSKTILRRVYHEGAAFLIEDTQKEYNGIESIYDAQIRSVLCVPLWDDKGIIGVIQIDNRSLSKAFTEIDLKILTIFGYYAAIALKNAQLFNDVLMAKESEEHTRKIFQRYVPQEVVDEILKVKTQTLINGELRNVTILFSDIRSFTSLSEELNPEILVSMLNDYFKEMVDIIFKYNGILDKFIGDGIMAVFGAPHSYGNDPLNAVKSAIEMIKTLEKVNLQNKMKGLNPLNIGIGIHTGDAIVGNIGSEKRMEYTVVGDTVNTASRIELQSATKNNTILISENTYKYVKAYCKVSEWDYIYLKGKAEKIKLFEVIDENI